MQTIQSFIQQACEDSGEVTYRSYSGRGMYGKSCVGIVSTQRECMKIVNAVNCAMVQELFDMAVQGEAGEHTIYEANDMNDQVQKAIDQLLSFETDSMGHSIVMYWPEMEFVKGESDEV